MESDLSAKHPVWVNNIPKFSGLKFLELCVASNLEISITHCPTYYTYDGRGDFLETVLHQNVKLTEVIATDILDSGKFQSCLPSWILLERGKLVIQFKLSQTGSGFKASHLNSCLEASKCILLNKLIIQHAILQPLQLRNTRSRLENLQFISQI
jgi:hypothetical protein